jgi:hypothetical protein
MKHIVSISIKSNYDLFETLLLTLGDNMTICKYALSTWSRRNLDIDTADGVVVIALDW